MTTIRIVWSDALVAHISSCRSPVGETLSSRDPAGAACSRQQLSPRPGWQPRRQPPVEFGTVRLCSGPRKDGRNEPLRTPRRQLVPEGIPGSSPGVGLEKWLQKQIGPAWTERGRPAAGYFTKRLGEDWLRSVLDRGRKPSTVAGYQAIVRSQLLPAFGAFPLESITAAMIEQWIGSAGGSASPRRKSLVLLRGIFGRANRVWGLAGNPAAEVEKPPLRRSGGIDVFSCAAGRGRPA
jgi:Phage integrase, N-terminal SAM-like domain